jgi:hypothetical protein
LAFRIFGFGKQLNKSFHALIHTGSVIFFSLGLYAVFKAHATASYNGGVIYPNIYSLHSMLGITSVALYCLNYVCGLLIFATNICSADMKKSYLDSHVKIGLTIFIASGMAFQSGLMELFTDLGCGYSVTSPDTNPAANYHLLPTGCKVMNGAAVFGFITIAATLYALVDIRVSESSIQPRDGAFESLLKA